MVAQDAPVGCGGKRPAGHLFAEVIVQEFRGGLVRRHEAGVLAFLRFGVRESELAGDFAYLGFRHAAEREDDVSELFLRESEEEIRLILFAVGTAGEDRAAIG